MFVNNETKTFSSALSATKQNMMTRFSSVATLNGPLRGTIARVMAEASQELVEPGGVYQVTTSNHALLSTDWVASKCGTAITGMF